MYKSWLPKLKSIAISLLYRRPRRRWVQKRLIMNLSLYIFGNTWFGVLPHKALPNLEELFNQLIHCRHIVTVYIFGGTSTAVSSHKALPNLEELPNQLIHCWNVIFARSSPALSLSCTAVHKLLDEHCRQVASTAITLLLLLYLIWKLFSINSHSHYSQSGTNGSVKRHCWWCWLLPPLFAHFLHSFPTPLAHPPPLPWGSLLSQPLHRALYKVSTKALLAVSRAPPPSLFTQQMKIQ